MSAQIRDMTKGSPAKLILLFAVPLMLGNIFQQLYTMVDTIVVGQVAGVQALAALGAVEWIMWMVLGVSTGVTQGFSILISQHYGARKWNDLKKAVAHSYLLTAITAVSLLIVSQLAARWILMLLNTPDNIIGMSLIYLRIVFCGIPIVAAYNIFASVLRTLGNSRTPLIAMIIAALINVILDLTFVAVLHWGVAGAALATVTAQAFSALYCFMVVFAKSILYILLKKILKQYPALTESFSDLVHQSFFKMSSFPSEVLPYSLSSMVTVFSSSPVLLPPISFMEYLRWLRFPYGYAIVSYVGQNLGAGKIDRIKKGIHTSAFLAFLTSAFISIMMFLFGKFLLSMFISGDPTQAEQVLGIAWHYLSIMASCLCILYFSTSIVLHFRDLEIRCSPC